MVRAHKQTADKQTITLGGVVKGMQPQKQSLCISKSIVAGVMYEIKYKAGGREANQKLCVGGSKVYFICHKYTYNIYPD